MDIISELINKYCACEIANAKDNQVFATINKDILPDALLWLKDFAGFTHLAFLTAVDFPEEEKIQLTYMLHNYQNSFNLALRVKLDRENPQMISIHNLWQQAEVYQRELREMFGIDFPGSPNLMENFALEGWHDSPPMLRTFNTREYSQKTYFPRPGRKSYDPQKYMKEKLYPDNPEEK